MYIKYYDMYIYIYIYRIIPKATKRMQGRRIYLNDSQIFKQIHEYYSHEFHNEFHNNGY